MEKKNNKPTKISSVSQFHTLFDLPKPLHPMISLVDNKILAVKAETNNSFLLDFYKISYKYSTNGKMGYGQGYYDFNEGGLMFTSPNQLIFTDNEEGAEYHGYTLFFHPDFIRNYPLGKTSRSMVSFHMIQMKRCIFLTAKKQPF